MWGHLSVPSNEKLCLSVRKKSRATLRVFVLWLKEKVWNTELFRLHYFVSKLLFCRFIDRFRFDCTSIVVLNILEMIRLRLTLLTLKSAAYVVSKMPVDYGRHHVVHLVCDSRPIKSPGTAL